MLGRYFRKHLVAMYPRLRFCSKIKIHPNLITIISLLPAFMAALFIIRKLYLWAAVSVVTSLALDILDGACARMTSQASKFGDYIDAFIDRYRECIFYFGFALAGYPLQAMFALSGSLLVSFAKARTAMCVPIEDYDWPAIGDMADRNIILIVGLVVAGIKPVWFSKKEFLPLVLICIGLLTHIGCFCRFLYAKKIIETKS